MADPFGRAVRDHYHGERDEPLLQCDGEAVLEHPIEQFYFSEYSPENETIGWFADYLEGPLLDMGAGAGSHALYFQEHGETVALEASEQLVTLMDERGVEDARQGDMFALRETFERDRFASALSYGTQLGLAGSMDGLRQFLSDLAYVTTPDATALLDCYDPTVEELREYLGYRADPAPGLAHRVMYFEYEDETGDILHFRLFSPDRMREAATPTLWTVSKVRQGSSEHHYVAVLEKDTSK